MIAAALVAAIVAGGYGPFATAEDAPAPDCPAPGCELWRTSAASRGEQRTYAVLAAGSHVFSGGHDGTLGYDGMSVLAFDAATGARQWRATHEASDRGYDHTSALAATPDGSVVFATGRAYWPDTHFDAVTLAYDGATGERLWASRINTMNHHDYGNAIALSPDGSRVFVAGITGREYWYSDYLVAALDATTGNVVWTELYGGADLAFDEAYDLAVSPNGSTVFVTGRSQPTRGSYDYATLALDAATGERKWVRLYDSGGHWDVARALTVTPDGSRVIVTGERSTADGKNEIATVSYEAATGTLQWVSSYDGPVSGWETVTDLTTSPDGARVFVTGRSQKDTWDTDYVTMAYDARTGSASWASRFDGGAGGQDATTGVATDGTGKRVIVTGRIRTATNGTDAMTIVYDAATGGTLWSARLDGPAAGNDEGTAVAVSRDGWTAFVAGTTTGTIRDAFVQAFALAVSPGAPTGVTAVPGPGPGEAVLSWNPPGRDGGEPVTTFHVYRALAGGALELVASTPGTRFADAGLPAGTAVSYAVAAENAVGVGDASTPLTVTTFDRPDRPRDVHVRAVPPDAAAGALGQDRLDVTWLPPVADGDTPLTAYRVYRSTAIEPEVRVAETPPGVTAFHDVGLVPGTAYTYRVSAVNAVGEGDASETACGMAADTDGTLARWGCALS